MKEHTDNFYQTFLKERTADNSKRMMKILILLLQHFFLDVSNQDLHLIITVLINQYIFVQIDMSLNTMFDSLLCHISSMSINY